MSPGSGLDGGGGERAPGEQSGYFLTRVFGDPEIAKVLSIDSTIESWLAVERSLAWAEADAGLLDPGDATAIESCATLESIDRAKLWEQTRVVGYPILPLIRMVASCLPPGPDGRVHYGATTQDIMDTGLALQLAAVAKRLDALLVEFGAGVAELVVSHRDTVMAARTHDQQAVPTTFGAKLAAFLGELARHRDRLHAAARRSSVVSLYGAGGTSAALGTEAQRVRGEVARRLGLGVCGTSWHAATRLSRRIRDGLRDAERDGRSFRQRGRQSVADRDRRSVRRSRRTPPRRIFDHAPEGESGPVGGCRRHVDRSGRTRVCALPDDGGSP